MLNDHGLNAGAAIGSEAEIGRVPDWRALYEELYEKIERTYGRLGHSLGFNPPIVSSVRSFEASPRILVLGLNPGGDRDYPDHRGKFRYENENAYVGVDWKGAGAGDSKLQQQVRGVFENLRCRLRPNCTPEQFAITEVVTANYIPFRSPNEASLHNPDATAAFALGLWTRIFQAWRPEFVVCYGKTPRLAMEQLLGSMPRPAQWDTRSPLRQPMRLHKLRNGIRLMGLPHLSRFPIFSFAENELAITEAFDGLCDGSSLK